jgi:predicted signal transduction protein with EAL and GGDEF domain
LRPADTAARLGGDEFAILVEDDLQTAGHAMWMAERILERLKEPLVIRGRELSITASIGVALAAPAHLDRPEELLREADLAMYQAKSKGKNRCDTFNPELVAARLEDPAGLGKDLEYALSREEFTVYYQPLVSLATGRIVEVEALLRWEHPEKGLLPPGSFLPLMEQSGLIVAVGQWMLQEACRQVHEWQEQYPDDPPLKLSANLSVKELQQPNLVREIVAILRKSKLRPDNLQLEVTENLMLGDEQTSCRKLSQLRDLGIEITVDDFGTGYSSLRLLRLLPKDDLKIDSSFIEGLGVDAEATAIVRTIVDLAHDLGLQVTAEGVENPRQVAHLREIGCDLAQGNHFSPPLSSETMSARLELASV